VELQGNVFEKCFLRIFDTTQQNINQHIRNIYKDGELPAEATHKKYLLVRPQSTSLWTAKQVKPARRPWRPCLDRERKRASCFLLVPLRRRSPSAQNFPRKIFRQTRPNLCYNPSVDRDTAKNPSNF
jgi:hypothetical protein